GNSEMVEEEPVLDKVFAQYDIAIEKELFLALRKERRYGNGIKAEVVDPLLQTALFRMIPTEQIEAGTAPILQGIAGESGVGGHPALSIKRFSGGFPVFLYIPKAGMDI